MNRQRKSQRSNCVHVTLSSVQVGALEAITVIPESGAGGRSALTGDYLYGDHREPYREAGRWGIFRVNGQAQPGVSLMLLPGS